MKKVCNCEARAEVEGRREFDGSNTFGRMERGVYVVYSYGRHFPMFVWKNQRWYFNLDRYSTSTARHQSQLRPSSGDPIYRTTTQMMELLEK